MTKSDYIAIDELNYSKMMQYKIVFFVLFFHFCCMWATYLHNPEFMLLDDNQIGGIPTCLEMGRLLRNGEIPLLNEYSWHAAGIAGEYTSAFFHPPFWIYCILVSMKLVSFECYAFIWNEWSYLVLLTGTFFLARELKLSPHIAGLVSMLMGSSGYLAALSPAWFVVHQSFAYLPWCWWAISRACSSTSLNMCLFRASMAGLILGLLITSGWTFTDFMALMVYIFVYLQFALSGKFKIATLACLLSGILGLGLSSPSWMMLIEYSSWSYRVTTQTTTESSNVSIFTWQDYLNLIYPLAGCHIRNLNCAIASNGSIATLIVIWSIITHPKIILRERKWFLFLMLTFIVCTLKDIHPFRWNFRFLPLSHLLICLISGLILQKYNSELHVGNLKRKLAFILLSAFSFSINLLAKYKLLLLNFTLAVPNWHVFAWISLLCVGVCSAYFVRNNYRYFCLGSTSLLITYLTITFYTPAWGFRINSPVVLPDQTLCSNSTWYYSNYSTGDDGFFSDYHRFLPGALNIHSGIKTINGYSTMGPLSSTSLFSIEDIGFDTTPDKILGYNIQSPALLRRMAIDGLILYPKTLPIDLPTNEFTKIGIEDGYEIWHRNSGPSLSYQAHTQAIICSSINVVMVAYNKYGSEYCVIDNPKKQILENTIQLMNFETFGYIKPTTQNSTTMNFAFDTKTNKLPSILTIARPWLPGYKASINNIPIDVFRSDTLMPAIIVEPGKSGTLKIEYNPDSWIYGFNWSITSLVAALSIITLYRKNHLIA